MRVCATDASLLPLSLPGQWTALTRSAPHTGFVLMASVTASPAGVAPTVRLPRPCARTSALVTAHTTRTPARAPVTRTGPGRTALLVCHVEANGGGLCRLQSPSYLFSVTEQCEVDCGSHGICYSGVCRCEEGWTGTLCEQKACHPLCSKNGVCKEGKCECDQGWTGEHCNIGEPGRRIHTHTHSERDPALWSHTRRLR